MSSESVFSSLTKFILTVLIFACPKTGEAMNKGDAPSAEDEISVIQSGGRMDPIWYQIVRNGNGPPKCILRDNDKLISEKTLEIDETFDQIADHLLEDVATNIFKLSAEQVHAEGKDRYRLLFRVRKGSAIAEFSVEDVGGGAANRIYRSKLGWKLLNSISRGEKKLYNIGDWGETSQKRESTTLPSK